MNVDIIARVRGAVKNEPPTKMEVGPDFMLRSRPGGQSVSFQYFYRQDHTNLDVFVRHVEPLVDMFFSGYNVCFMCYGESDSGKSYTMAGDSSYKSGVIPLALANIFKKLEADDERLPGGMRKVSHKCVIQMFEIYDEKVRDILVVPTSSADYLSVGESADKGSFIKALSSVQVTKAAEATTLFREGWHRRTATMINSQEAGNRASVIFQIDLNLTTTDSPLPNRSRFTFVDLPGAEKIVLDPTDMRLREGSTLNRAVISLGRLIADLSNKPSANRAINYYDSVVTRLLENELGGNCKTRVLFCLRPFPDADILAAVLRTAAQTALVKNFPLVNDFFAQQLMIQFRARVISGATWDVGSELTPDNMAKINRETREELRRLQTENLELRDKNERLQYRMEHLQLRHGHVAHDRTDVSTQLLTSEEEKLKVSKALVEIEIENNKLREEAESVRFELTNKILSLENELLEAQMQRDRFYADAIRLHEVEKERKDLAEEYIALKASFTQNTKDHDGLIAKNEELSMELLNLVNAKATLLRQMGTIELLKQKKIADPDIEIERIKNMIAKNRADLATAASNGRRYTPPVRRTPGKGFVEDDVSKLRNHYDDEQRKLKIKIGELIRDLQESKTLAQNRLQDMSETKTRIITLRSENEYLEQQLNRMQHKVKNVYEEYRNRLIRYVEGVAEYVDGGRGVEMNQMRDYVSQMLDDIRNSHEMREAQLSSAAQNYRRKMIEMRKKHEHLLIIYASLRQQVLEAGDVSIPPGPDVEEVMLLDPDEDATQKQISRLKNELSRAKLKASAGAAGYRDEKEPTDEFPSLRRKLREFTHNTQSELEVERADLLARNEVLQEQLNESQEYIEKHMAKYRDEILRLKDQGITNLPSPTSWKPY